MAGYRRVEGTEEIIWRGRSYRRFPDHRLRHRRVYFMATTYPRTYLHRDIYTAHHGPIPEGWHVHHIDHDPLNNDPANLASISAEEHLRHHGEHRSEFIAVCDECGQRYPAKRKGARWCSPACKERRRRRDGVACLHLCGSGTTGCHGMVTEHPARAYDRGWSVRSGFEPAEVPVVFRGNWALLTDDGAVFRPPHGRDRCERCGFHMPTQGHRSGCQEMGA